jgi:choline-sulfatase
MTRPNILLIQADQLTALCLAAYGKPFAKTPNIDAIAERGTVYANNYCNNPVCGPSRASMMVGRLPSDVGVYDNAGEFASYEPTYPHYLRMLGYKTTLVGKMHFVGPDQLHGYEHRLTTDIYPSDYGWTADWTQTTEPYSPSQMSLHSVVESGLCERSLQIDYDEHVYNTARQELFDHARSIDDRPFMMHVSFTHPHNPFVTTPEFWNLYDDAEIPEPQTPYIPYEDRDPWSQRYFLTIRQDEFDITPEQLHRSRRAYFAMTSYFDSLIGGLLDVLERTGQLENTCVIVTSDHGEMLGERGMWFKFNPYEHSVRVPMIAMGPGFGKGRREEALTSLVDLMPTLTDIANDGEFSDFRAPIDGRSLFSLPERHGPEDKVHIEYNGEGLLAPALIVVKGDKKVVHSRTDPLMVFDLSKDPLEHDNIAGSGDPAEDDLMEEICARWDEDALEADVLESQRKRILVQDAMKHGQFPSWDYTPSFDASTAYVRGAIDPNTTATKARRRFPFVPTTPPGKPRKSL